MNRNYTEIPATVSEERIGLLRMYAFEVIPEYTRMMPVKNRASFYAPKEQAVAESPWIQLHQNDRHWVLIDFDCGDEWAWKRLPMTPNFVSYNTNTGNHQAGLLLEAPVHCHKEAKRRTPYKYLKAIEKAIDAQYGGDNGFRRTISKNPFHPQWDTNWIHDKKHTLKEIEDGLELVLNGTKRRTQAVKGEGKRNTSVFDRVRFKCYNQVSRYKEVEGIKFEDWHTVVIQWCNDANVFKDDMPMKDAEVRCIAKSIATFTWYIYKPKSNKKRMTVEEIKAAQSKAAAMTTAKKVGKNEAAIKEAIRQLKSEGKKPTKAAAARLAGLGRVAVSRNYSHLFD
jgi:hypothetical protein